MHKYTKTGFKPAELHLSRSSYLGNSSIFHLLNGDTPVSSPQLGELKEALMGAHKLNQAKKILVEQGSKDLARNERRHGSLYPDSEFLETYPRLGLVLILTHREEKFSKTPTYAGPALILARQTLDRNLFLLDLTTGCILKRSHRQVKPYASADFLNLPEDVRNTLQSILPLGIVHQGLEIPSMGQGLSTGEWTVDKKQIELSTVLRNILTVFRLIKDSLPGIEPATPYTINLDEEEDDEIAPPKEVRFHSPSQGLDFLTSPPEEPIPSPVPTQTLDLPHRPKRTIIKPARFRD